MRRALPALVSVVTLLLAGAPPVRGQDDGEAWLLEVARTYRTWGRVDDELRWAPFLCRMPFPSRARVSEAAAAHGRKVYFVYASDRAAYVLGTRAEAPTPPPVGLTVVKEAFAPRPLTDGDQLDGALPYGGHARIPGAPAETRGAGVIGGEATTPEVYRPIRGEDGGFLGAGPPRGLYVLRYLGPNAPGTDAGWTYGTVDAEGRVTSSGQVAGCVGCHRDAPHGRLFGLD